MNAGPERDTALLLTKSTLATVISWQLAVHLLHSSTPFYAPMAALLVVDRTVVRSLLASAQRLAAVTVGMAVAELVEAVAGVHWWSMLPVMLLALLLGRWRRLGEHGIQVPAMVLLALVTAGGTSAGFTYMTLLETVAGGLVGVVTNVAVFPPLHVREPRQRVDALAAQVRQLLTDMADGLRQGWDAQQARDWYDRSSEIAQSVPEVIEHVSTGRESTRFNPRENVRPMQINWVGYERAVETLRRAQWQAAGIARTLVDGAEEEAHHPAPSSSFLPDYASVLESLGSAVGHFGRRQDEDRTALEEDLRRANSMLERLRDEIRDSPLADPHAWPAYGALIIDAQRMVREFQAEQDQAAVPTDTGPVPVPLRGPLLGRAAEPRRDWGQ
jgi:uncharacterized membrane protein YgaE (UPF0421/DUF939 family)